MLAENPPRTGTDHLGRRDVVLAELAEHIGPHDPGQLRHVKEGDRDDHHRQDRQPARQSSHQHSGQGDAREAHDDIEGAHDDLGNGPACGGGDGAEHCRDQQREPGGEQADDQRDAGAVDGAREQVASGVVGAEPEHRVRGDRIVGHQLDTHTLDLDLALDGHVSGHQAGRVGRVGCDQGCEDRRQDDQAEHGDGDFRRQWQAAKSFEPQTGVGQLLLGFRRQHQMLRILGLTST